MFERDLEYWRIDPYSLGELKWLLNDNWKIYLLCPEPCCALKYFPEVDIRQNEKDMDLRAKVKAMETAEEEDFGSSSISEIRSWLWNTLEYPWTSKLAQFLAFFSLSMVMLSTVTFIISTQLIDPDGNVDYVEYPTAVYLIDLMDNFVTIFFSGEFITRLVICPRKVKFLKKSMNIVDLLAIAPFYVSLLLGNQFQVKW